MYKSISVAVFLAIVVAFSAHGMPSYLGIQGARHVITEESASGNEVVATYLGLGIRFTHLNAEPFGLYAGGHTSVYNYLDVDGTVETFAAPAINVSGILGLGSRVGVSEHFHILIGAGPQANFFVDMFNYDHDDPSSDYDDISSRSILNYSLGLAVDLNAEFAVSDSTAIGLGAELAYDPLTYLGRFVDVEGYSQYRLHPYMFMRR